ncbi:MAG: BrnT family toxin [Thermodesulfobacteriota bacterium]
MEFEWDPAKARENIRVHGINFAAAAGVFNNPYLPREDTDAKGENRFVALGVDGLGRVLVVVYTYRSEKIKINIGPESQQERRERICAKSTISVKQNS